MLDRERGLRFARVLGCLNKAFKADPSAMQALCTNRVPVNDILVNNTGMYTVADPNMLGVLGVVNGVLEAAGLEKVSAIYDLFEDGHPKMLGFVRYEEGDLHAKK